MRNIECSSGGRVQSTKIYIKNLVIIESGKGRFVDFTPTLFQRVKSYFGLFPSKRTIENAVRKEMLGEMVE